MKTSQIVSQLQAKYPGKPIFIDGHIIDSSPEEKASEIICELEPTSDHPDYSVAIAVIDRSIPHHHKQTEEIYEVLTGQLKLHLNDKVITLNLGDTHTIKPGTHHFAEGNETWIKATSHPGWTPEDHHLIITS